MGKKNKRITRAMKIERAMEEARREAAWKRSVWYPVPGATMEEAVEHVVVKLHQRESLIGEPELEEELGDVNTFINSVPLVVMNRAQSEYESELKLLYKE